MVTTAAALDIHERLHFTPGCQDTLPSVLSDDCRAMKWQVKRKVMDGLKEGFDTARNRRILLDSTIMLAYNEKLNQQFDFTESWIRQAMIVANESDTINMTREFCSALHDSKLIELEEYKPTNCTHTITVDETDAVRFLFTEEAATLVVQSGIEECIKCSQTYQGFVAHNKLLCPV